MKSLRLFITLIVVAISLFTFGSPALAQFIVDPSANLIRFDQISYRGGLFSEVGNASVSTAAALSLVPTGATSMSPTLLTTGSFATCESLQVQLATQSTSYPAFS